MADTIEPADTAEGALLVFLQLVKHSRVLLSECLTDRPFRMQSGRELGTAGARLERTVHTGGALTAKRRSFASQVPSLLAEIS